MGETDRPARRLPCRLFFPLKALSILAGRIGHRRAGETKRAEGEIAPGRG